MGWTRERIERRSGGKTNVDELTLISENTEWAALTDLHAPAPEETPRLLELRLETIGTVLVSVGDQEPSRAGTASTF